MDRTILSLVFLAIFGLARSDWLLIGECIVKDPFAYSFEVQDGNCALMNNINGSNPTKWMNLVCPADSEKAVVYECKDPDCQNCKEVQSYALRLCDKSSKYNYVECSETKPDYAKLMGSSNYAIRGYTADNCTSTYRQQVKAVDTCIVVGMTFTQKIECKPGYMEFTGCNDPKCEEQIGHDIFPLGCSVKKPGFIYGKVKTREI